MYTVVIPVLNEEQNLRELLPRIVNNGCTVIVCDNGSTDDSVKAATSLGAVVSHGRGSVADAVFRGLEIANYGPVVIMDADLSHPPGKVVDAVDGLFGGYDIVIMSRYTEGGNSLDSPWNRFISRLGNIFCWGLCPDVKDRMSGFFCIRKTALDGVPGARGARRTTKPMLELLTRGDLYNTNHWREIPYTFCPRTSGKSKLGRSWSVPKTLYDVSLLYLVRYRKMLKFLVVGGVGIGINLGLLAFFTEVAGMWYILSAVLGIFVATVWNFALNNLWTFGDRSLKEAWQEKGSWHK